MTPDEWLKIKKTQRISPVLFLVSVSKQNFLFSLSNESVWPMDLYIDIGPWFGSSVRQQKDLGSIPPASALPSLQKGCDFSVDTNCDFVPLNK